MSRLPCSPEDDFGGPLTLPVTSPAGQNVHVFSDIARHLLDGLAENYVQTFMVSR